MKKVKKVEIGSKELKQACEMLLDKAITAGFDHISFDMDYYWCVTSDERENIEEPKLLGVGSLFDDVTELKRMLSGENPVTTNDFERLANILIAMCQRIDRSNKLFL